MLFDPLAGSSIDWTIAKALKMARKYQRHVRFYFNGLRITVHKRLSFRHVYNQWEHMREARSLAYRQSQEYRDQLAETARETDDRQKQMTELFRVFDTSVKSLPTLVGSMAQLSDCGDWIHVDWGKAWADAGCPPTEKSIHKELVQRMQAEGYYENEGVVPKGTKFDGSTSDKVGRWIIGQCINCLNKGMPPHPVVQRFGMQYLEQRTGELARAEEAAKAKTAPTPVADCPPGHVDISLLDKAEVLVALYNGSRQQGLGFLHAHGAAGLSLEDARELLKQTFEFDYLRGRVMKINLRGDSFNPWGYDRDIGQGAAARVIQQLIASKRITPPPATVAEETVEDERLRTPVADVFTGDSPAPLLSISEALGKEPTAEVSYSPEAVPLHEEAPAIADEQETDEAPFALCEFNMTFRSPVSEIAVERMRSSIATYSRGDVVITAAEDGLIATVQYRRFTPEYMKGLLELLDKKVPNYMTQHEELTVLNKIKARLVELGSMQNEDEPKAEYTLPVWLTASCGFYGVNITKKLNEEEVNKLGDVFVDAVSELFPYPDADSNDGQFVIGMLVATVKAPKEDTPVVTMKGGADGDEVINVAFPSRLSDATVKRVADGIAKFSGKVVSVEHTADFEVPVWLTAMCAYYGVTIAKPQTAESVESIQKRFIEEKVQPHPYPGAETEEGQRLVAVLRDAV